MRLVVFSILICCGQYLQAQYTLRAKVTDEQGILLSRVEVYESTDGQTTKSNSKGLFVLDNLTSGTHRLTLYYPSYKILIISLDINNNLERTFVLYPLGEQLSEVFLRAEKDKAFALQRLKKVEGTRIYAGKKTEVVLLDKTLGNIATNNAREIYSQVVGLNIYDNNDGGIQLNIGGRGLDPNRSKYFNIRQNNYDISADVLGYPESYYTPPPEALSQIEVVRGAASLQYGTQFGGLVNFKFKPPSTKKISLTSRQSAGSYKLLTSFNRMSGTLGKFSYSTYYHYKKGDGFRVNSGYNSHNIFAHLAWAFSEKTSIATEYTHLYYLAQQPGGLTDAQFYKNPNYSNRSRNWFEVNWNLYALKFKHQFSDYTNLSFNLFGLGASRSALGYRENRVSQSDDLNEPRELLIDYFNNWGAEARLLKRYSIAGKPAIWLIGSKYYRSNNHQQQGPGKATSDADFSFANKQYPTYDRQAIFDFPNENVALFTEHIFNINDRWSLTPGARIEYIRTQSQGYYKNFVFDLADNVIQSKTIDDNRRVERNFVLLGLGSNYQFRKSIELYANLSENYRSITFNDIRVINPSAQVDPNISDESGYSSDIGLRGFLNDKLSYDVSLFGLWYNDRIGEILTVERRDNQNSGRFVRYRTNIGDAFIYGLETFADWNIRKTLFAAHSDYSFNFFVNLALTSSEYKSSKENNVKGNKVEFIPNTNLKMGIRFGYKNLLGSLQYTYLSEQYSDASNSPQNRQDNQRGIEGSIPAYGVADFSMSYKRSQWQINTGINNLFNQSYFTRRATGYPGPGIIPAQPLTWYLSLEVRL